jgi:hypothetical protein
VNRLNYPVDLGGHQVTTPLQYGDVVLVQANAPGLFYAGKLNVNEQHSTDPAKDFSITILQRGTTPTAAQIALSDLKNASDDFLFDATRATGCERYQGGLVHLDGLTLVDPADWGLGKTVTVRQGVLTFPMQLGLDPALALVDAAALNATPFSATAILDQEDGSSPYTGGYSLWLTSASGLMVVPEPGSLISLTLAALTASLIWRRRPR